MSIYNCSVPSVSGGELKLLDYKDKIMPIANTATGYGSMPHYEPLEVMHEADHDKGPEIIDIPCNQFAGQTPDTDGETRESCTLKYHATLPQQKKSEMNDEYELLLYTSLKSQQGLADFGEGPRALIASTLLLKQDRRYAEKPDIKQGSTRFAVDRDGDVVKRSKSTADMAEVSASVEGLL